jgi:hypothetical protein
MGGVCSFPYHVMEMVWCLVLSIFLLIKCTWINHEFLHGLSFSSSHMICYCILTFLKMIVWIYANEIKCNTCLFLYISCRPFQSCVFYHFGLWCVHLIWLLIIWLEFLLKWSIRFPYTFMKKLGGELERRSHTQGGTG